MPELLAQFENRYYEDYDNGDPDLDDDGLEMIDGGISQCFRDHKVKTSRRPLRSVLYYMKGHDSASISLTPVQLPPRSKILQVRKIHSSFFRPLGGKSFLPSVPWGKSLFFSFLHSGIHDCFIFLGCCEHQPYSGLNQ